MKKAIIFLALISIFALSACTSTEAADGTNTAGEISQNETAKAVVSSEMFTDRDLETGYAEETSGFINLLGDTAESDSAAVSIEGSTVAIKEEGTYILAGTLTDGMIVVDAEDTDKVQLVLNQAEITNATSAAIYVLQGDKVFITAAAGTENTLENGGEYVAIDDNNIDAVIFSKADLTLNGMGSLTINAQVGHGVVSKDDLIFASGTYNITAAEHGISGKDSVRIAGGSYTISSGKDGIHAENSDDSSLGFLYIAGGDFAITAEGDGMSAGAYLQIDDGEIAIFTGEGSDSVTMTTEQRPFERGENPMTENTLQQENSVSQKGLKADGTITINSGNIVTDTADDSLHAGGAITITNGEFTLKSGDYALHSDADVNISDGVFTISYCYEGIEGLTVTIDNGTFAITSVDDGINAADGTDSANPGGGREQFAAASQCFITINGGEFTIVSGGDCLDSNGDLTINGGILDLTCNSNGNTALDCDGTYTNNGGEVTTNDGSENNPGQMGGGKPGGGMPNNQEQMKDGRGGEMMNKDFGKEAL